MVGQASGLRGWFAYSASASSIAPSATGTLAISGTAPLANRTKASTATTTAHSAGRAGKSRQRSHSAATAPPQVNSEQQRARPDSLISRHRYSRA